MKVFVAEKCGFCPGVRAAIESAQKTLAAAGPVYSLGPIIHNQDVVEQLAQKGLKPVQNVDEISAGTVIIRSHGATEQQLHQIRQKGLEIVDATCVLVKRVQKIAKALAGEGYQVIMIGDKNHPEVQAVVGSAPNVTVVGSSEDIDNLPKYKKIGLIGQTTQNPEDFIAMAAALMRRGFVEIKIVNTLCRETMERQQAAVKLCRQVDVMFVLGGLHSANTKKLAELCKKHNPNTFHLQNWQELDRSILFGKKTAGVTAGASTPDEVIEEFVRNLEKIDDCPSDKPPSWVKQ